MALRRTDDRSRELFDMVTDHGPLTFEGIETYELNHMIAWLDRKICALEVAADELRSSPWEEGHHRTEAWVRRQGAMYWRWKVITITEVRRRARA